MELALLTGRKKEGDVVRTWSLDFFISAEIRTRDAEIERRELLLESAKNHGSLGSKTELGDY